MSTDSAGSLMDCEDLVEMLTDYLDGVLDPQTRSTLEAHLQLCDGCDAYLEQLRATVAALGAAPSPQLAPNLQEALMTEFRHLHR